MKTDRSQKTDRGEKADREVKAALREIVDAVLSGEISSEADLDRWKRKAGRKFGLADLPKNADILAEAGESERARLKLLGRKPTRTLSGVAVVAAMTSPAPCPHGVCVPCPGGVGRRDASPTPQSYTGREPAAMRAIQHGYDPYLQVRARLRQLEEIGHPVDKVDLIVMGGTITSRPLGYQTWFVKRCLEAMNDHPGRDGTATFPDSRGCLRSFREVAAANESSRVRNVGTTFETRPDWCGPTSIRNMLLLGGTKVELGVQSTDDELLGKMRRGHSAQDAVDANRALRDAGLKVGFHMMPGLPGSDPRRDLASFRALFDGEDWRPDYLKIYPALVVEGTELYDLYLRGEYEPLGDDEAAQLLSRIKEMIPPYVRLQRVQRDIPAPAIAAGVKKSNLRQLAKERLLARGGACRCIRCREAGLRGVCEETEVSIRDLSYQACGGEERFLSYETDDGTLAAFLRLRLKEEARVRELHVYGPMTPLGERGGWQHRGLGSSLLAEAEEISLGAGYDSLYVTSGIGARPYYRRHGYRLAEPYMVKGLR
ncbi:tRNA uridine(34) 5-carboxymethylaminomethyl modification radical SAM/GNAT enzyme Elp3 [Methanotrichaceae archaeon M04Ac]|uniref:tRNA carboxymethyluridine synthase n=1 Tax=Candidatus Methanocrinis alkalitolerans TaxID=3033395 RepID=A0ABT5XBZ0_9EURY|nr:tRNA uridine(34) 5-carboxymethylaminomethyl modification radical SAM/GNAT enzyme Elp3 [Candidatus Methanocrinis alkalitolerans]MDF0592062.1 tRNA uridine(34) 5-carboxymethylaminomethyl modification radical SAM/GNAT enzyme Elp3 [Candidatus Methanocrinis alkalitolerans]